MKNNFLKLIVLALLTFTVGSCYKTSPGLGGAGITVVQFPSTVVINSYLTVAGSQTFSIVEVRRDIPSESVLNTTQTATITLNPTVITNYNTANGATYTALPSTAYAFDASNPATNGVITLTFAPGEYSKSIKIVMDLTNIPASPVKSALGFSITAVSAGAQISAASKDAFVSIGAKNAYEASYAVTGYLFHPTAERAIAATKAMTTLSPSRVSCALGDLGGSNYYVAFDVTGGALVNYSAVGATPAAPASGFFTSDNPGGIDFTGNPAPVVLPGTSPWLHSTYNNTYDDAKKTFWMHYGYGGGSTSQTGWSRQVYEKWVRQ